MIGSIKNWYLTRGDSQSAWERCLPIWYQDGGIDDWRGIGGMPFYSPSRGVRLARRFAKRHSKDAESVLEHTQNNDPVIALCAVDLLVEIAAVAPPALRMLAASELPLSESLLTTLTEDAELRAICRPAPEFDTVGSYFRWQFETSIEADDWNEAAEPKQ